MKDKKGMMISIIIMLSLTMPLAILGIYYNSKGISSDNPKKEFHYNNKLYYYDGNNLLGTYNCKNKICDVATNTSDDENYELLINNKTFEEDHKAINNRYAFIKDVENETDNIVSLYDLKRNLVLVEYQAKKEYGLALENDLYIIQNKEGKWGVISLENEPLIVIPFKYQYVGVGDLVKGEFLDSSYFVIKDENGWGVTSPNSANIGMYYDSPIYKYNDSLIYTNDNDIYGIYLHDGISIISDYKYKKIENYDKFLGLLTTDNKLIIYDLLSLKQLGETLSLLSTDFDMLLPYPPYTIDITDDSIKITLYSDQSLGTKIEYSYIVS